MKSVASGTCVRAALVACAVLLLCAGAAEARRGGSIGGRSGFSGSRSSGSSSSGSSSGGGWKSSPSPSRSYGGGSHVVVVPGGGYGGYGYGGGGAGLAFVVVLLVGFGFVMVIGFVVVAARRRKQGSGGSGPVPVGERCAVARVSVAYFASEKRLLAALDGLAERSGHVPVGDARDAFVLREASLLMSRSLDAGCGCHVEQAAGLSLVAARSKLESEGIDLRSRFDEEGVRADEQGALQQESPRSAPVEEDGPAEKIVVSLVAAFREPALAQTHVGSAQELAAALRELGAVPADRLLGIEVVWDPESPDESLTGDEYDQHYPELGPI